MAWQRTYKAAAAAWRNDHCPALRAFEDNGKVGPGLITDIRHLARRLYKCGQEPNVEAHRAAECMSLLAHFLEKVSTTLAVDESRTLARMKRWMRETYAIAEARAEKSRMMRLERAVLLESKRRDRHETGKA